MNQAAYFGHAPCLRHLLAFKADVNILDSYGGTPLVAAALNGEDECIRVLLEAGANVNQLTTNGNTPLMKAALNGHAKCVRMLIVAGADVALKNRACKGADGTDIQPKDALTLAKEAIRPIIEELVEIQKECIELKSQTLNMPFDAKVMRVVDTYVWDAVNMAFVISGDGGKEISTPIIFDKVGPVNPCNKRGVFSCSSRVSGLGKLPQRFIERAAHIFTDVIAQGATFGWDHEAHAWTFFTDPSSDFPSYFAEYGIKEEYVAAAPVNLRMKRATLGPADKELQQRKRVSLNKVKDNYSYCIQALGMKVEDIQEEDWARIKEKDSTRKDSHLKTFEMQALALKRELQEFVNTSTWEFCCDVDNQERQDTLDEVVRQFMTVKQKHQERSPKWYNDDGRYRSGVIEMLSMKDNSMAVPRLTMTMYQEWKSKQSFLRQADRMVSRERFRCVVSFPADLCCGSGG